MNDQIETAASRDAVGQIAVEMASLKKETTGPGVAAKVLALWPPLVLGAVFVVMYLLQRARMDEFKRFLLPSLAEHWSDGIGNPTVLGEVWDRLLITAQIAILGLMASIALGMLLGIIMFHFNLAERAFYPFLVTLQSVPILAVAPLLQQLLGFGLAPKIIVAFIISFFPIPTTLLLGLKSVPQGLIDVFRLRGASSWTILRKVGIPSAMPSLFAGFRISAGLSVIGAIVGELFFRTGAGGLGQMLINRKIELQYPQMYAAMFASAAFAVSVYLVFNYIGARLFNSWHESGEQG
ncbi:MAG: ABC transporter permease subunit [Acidimicrobiales bacterium]